MEIMLYIFGGVAAAGMFLYSFEKPYMLLSLVIFMYLYPFNIETPLPLDARGIIMLFLFGMLVIFRKEKLEAFIGEIFKNKFAWLITLFFFISFLINLFTGDSFIIEIRDLVLSIVSLSIGYFYVKDKESPWYLLLPVLLMGILSSYDTIYSHLILGTFDIIRQFDVILGREVLEFNHNYYGLLTAFGLIFSLFLFIKKKINRFIGIILITINSAGVFISTSRSSLLAVIGTFVVMFIFQPDMKYNPRKILTGAIIFILFIAGFYFGYGQLKQTAGISSDFVDDIYFKVFEEPAQIFDESQQSFNEGGNLKEGTMSWRLQKSLGDIQKYQNFTFFQQMFGLGAGNYLTIAEIEYLRNNILKYTAHNGYVLILIERGAVGLLLYLIIFLGLTFKSFFLIKKYNTEYPISYLIWALAIYSIGQNGEFTNPVNFLFFGGMMAYIYYHSNEEEFIEDEEEEIALQKNYEDTEPLVI